MKPLYHKLVVKIGTNVLSQDNGLLDIHVMECIVADIAALYQQGVQIVVVSSGAVGSGRAVLHVHEKISAVTARQVLAAVGQVRLMNTYAQLFDKHALQCAQVLVTKEDFRDRRHYLNMQNCLEGLLAHGIIPIVNENDVVSVTELMFTDNDELSGLLSSMIQAEALVILTNVDGIFDGNPRDPSSRLLSVIDTKKVDLEKIISPEKSSFGRGGMLTKAAIARKLTLVGITVRIAHGKKPHILRDIVAGKPVGTTFLPRKNASSIKRWVAHAEGYEKGTVYVNEGAVRVLTASNTAASVLPVGITRIEGEFEKGDIVRLCADTAHAGHEHVLGYGMVQYNSARARELIGKAHQKPLIHYDYLFIAV
ncbi:MAG: glutamate 5-kinase [Bacteroidota bacterium]|nr:glutamate 5-kinase [Candidatus Kapabacteria bacterium]MDW8219018.1 glutamate 5-kinase [Bacteroidota bacterium]